MSEAPNLDLIRTLLKSNRHRVTDYHAQKMLAHIEALERKLEVMTGALRPFTFSEMGRDEDEGADFTTQEVWDTVKENRISDWFEYQEIDRARQALKELEND